MYISFQHLNVIHLCINILYVYKIVCCMYEYSRYKYLILYLSAFHTLSYCIALLRKNKYSMPRKHEVNPTQVYTLFWAFKSLMFDFTVVVVVIFESSNTSFVMLLVLLIKRGRSSGSVSYFKMLLNCSLLVRVYWLHFAHMVNFERDDCFLSFKL